MVFHYIKMYQKTLHLCFKTFGIGIWFFYYLFKIPVKVAYIHFTLFLDDIFFRGYRKVKIEKPIFIIGHPRSATTFLHKTLKQTGDFLVFKDWEMENPSLIIKQLLKRHKILRVLFSVFDLRFTPHKFKSAIMREKDPIRNVEPIQARKKNVDFIGQEEESLFLHVLDTQLLTVTIPLGFEKNGYPEICFNDEQPHQEKSVLFFKNCLKRQIYYTGKKQVIAKLNFSLFRVKTLLKIFPDAKFVYIVRSPMHTIPSHLSLHRRLLDRYFGLNNIPKSRLQQYFKNRYQYNVEFYKHFEELKKDNVIPMDRLLEITYDDIQNDLLGVIRKIKHFGGLTFSTELEERLKKQANQQSSYERKHKNLSLEQFGLTEERIRSDLDFVFKQYGFGDDVN